MKIRPSVTERARCLIAARRGAPRRAIDVTIVMPQRATVIRD
jgi:hypothetical protein